MPLVITVMDGSKDVLVHGCLYVCKQSFLLVHNIIYNLIELSICSCIFLQLYLVHDYYTCNKSIAAYWYVIRYI